ncbi:MAG: hypothetical protein PHT33_09075 [bacterium]|nr:hypothetical protein [bacterium]
MTQPGYKQYIIDNIHRFPFGLPIYTNDIANDFAGQFEVDVKEAKALVNVYLKRIADNGDLKRYCKGIYYRAQETPFGETRLNPAHIISDTYLQKNGVVIGYETGASFLNRIGLTTQIAKYKHYATNAFKQNGSRVDKKLNAVIRRPPATVTEENHQYLQLLDAIANKDHVPIDAHHPETFFLDYIRKNGLDFAKLVAYGSKYYKKEMLLRIGEIAASEL